MSVLMAAFNKHIADELTSRIGNAGYRNATGQTLHSVGMAAYRTQQRFIKVNSDKTRYIVGDLMGFDQMNADQRKEYFGIVGPICRMMSLLKNFGFGAIRADYTKEDVLKLADRYDVELPDDMEKFIHNLENTYKASKAATSIIDFDDMLWLPLLRKAQFPSYDFVFVDESQDLNPIQIAIVEQLVRRGGRAIFVGDRNQAIYGFRGADPEAMDTIKSKFNATELPLSICWRCPKSVIAAAKEIVPQIEASPKAAEGSIRTINEDVFMTEVASGDYALCRVTAPLANKCLKLIQAGRKAIVRGRDIGQNLVTMLTKVEKSMHVGTLVERIQAYGDEELAKVNKPGRESQYIALSDKLTTLVVLADGIDSFDAMRARIESIFSDTDAGVVFSTIHKAKGLEANRVYVLQPELLPHPLAKQEWQRIQEHNLRYVAITRAMQELVWVETNKK